MQWEGCGPQAPRSANPPRGGHRKGVLAAGRGWVRAHGHVDGVCSARSRGTVRLRLGRGVGAHRVPHAMPPENPQA